MKLKFILTASSIALSSLVSLAQKTADVEMYVAKYKDLAIAEQKRTGVPAAIKLAQGIHESGCGSSELSINANNHFGIKCKSNWIGETYTYTDDAKNECFRKYNDDKGSYMDHSDFLKNSARYASLFTLNATDYKAWAYGLKKCGYATNPKYAQRIVDLVEKYNLNQYSMLEEVSGNGDDEATSANEIATMEKLNSEAIQIAAEEQALQSSDREYYIATVKNGLKGFYGKKGDLLLNAAYKYNIRYAKLLDLNDLADEPLPEDMFIYLERKSKEGKSDTYQLQEGESLISVAQEQGIRLKELKQYNHLKGDEEPEVGSVLHLKNTAPKKPLLRAPLFGKGTNPQFSNAKNENSEYTAGGKKASIVVENKTIAGENEVPVAQAKTPVVKQEEKTYNIADEPAIEEVIKEEKRLVDAPPSTATKAAPVKGAVEEEEMSDLDRLKAKLDKSVYGNDKKTNTNPAPKQTVVAPKTEVYETRPAASRANTNVVVEELAKQTKVTGAGQDALRKRIEANNQSGRSEPVVANRSNANLTSANHVATPAATSGAKKPAAKAASKKEPAKPSVHVVKKGENLSAISSKYGISSKDLIKLNKLPANGSVKAGAKIKLK